MSTTETGKSFSLPRMALSGVTTDWRTSLAIALGVAIATAVVVGALLVGDSMRGSLRGLTIERLGRIESVIAPGGFFEAAHFQPPGEDLTGERLPDSRIDSAIILFDRGVLESSGDVTVPGSVRRAGSVQIVGCDHSFWDFDVSGITPKKLPADDEVILTQRAAAEIGVGVGDLVTIRLPSEQAVPADSPLGRRDSETVGLPRMKVIEILPDEGLARFALSPSQAAPMNVFLDREMIADSLDRQGKANVLLSSGELDAGSLPIELPDLRLQLTRVQSNFADSEQSSRSPVIDYYSLTSDRLLLPEAAADQIIDELDATEITPVMTYLANAIERVDDSGKVIASVPYSIITGIDSSESLPVSYVLGNDDVSPDSASTERASIISDAVPLVINDWTARRLGADVETMLRIAYYEPEVENGKEIERYFDAVVTEVVPITEPSKPFRRSRPAEFDKPPTVYNDSALTPSVPGVTDQDSISDWDLPFQLTREIPKEDDEYWQNHRLTPKAFLPLADARRIFGSRFGETTGLRISTDAAEDIESLGIKIRQVLQPALADLGWSVRSIQQQQLAASRGTTPFDGLFLSLSFFVIFSAIMLIAMLLRLGLIGRLRQFGALMAVGWTRQQVAKLVLTEGAWIATFGVLLGVIGGIGYARGVLWALRHWWVGAVTVPFLNFHWTTLSLLIGSVAGWLVAMATIWLTIRNIVTVPATKLLTGRDDSDSIDRAYKPAPWLQWSVIIMPVIALVAAIGGAIAGGQAAAGGFVGGGMLLLVTTLIAVFLHLRSFTGAGETGEPAKPTTSLTMMATRSASRSPLRSTLTIGLMATASFLIIAISAFRLQPTDRGTGGFEWVAQSAQPIYRDLGDKKFQAETFGPDKDELDGTTVISMRMRLGQDASCNNLYQAAQPTVLGVPPSMQQLIDNNSGTRFDWAGVGDTDNPDEAAQNNAWMLLEKPAAGTQADPIPVVIDQNTAMWSFQMYGGVGQIKSFEYETGKPTFFKVVGLLSNSVLQGKLLIGESNFQKAFPDVSGYQYFLIDSGGRTDAKVSDVLERRLGDVGMDVSKTADVLSGMLAVQNTYLRTFQSLGALGLLLGTVGLAIAQLRAVLQRRQELAVMRAIGFTRGRLASLVMGETAALLFAGIGCGILCAVLAVLPYAWLSGMNPPIIEPLVIVAAIIVFGLIAGLVAVIRVVRMPLLQSLRAE
ncbi:ABC transporter permease [Stieleria varia]|uniref:FtsX-like permease family protein n=1 Tax=Stieleria varia TaxID=2528005 RepID=A0A5C6ANZ2_9BACT|nr:FtsX-like permease family protein [Stieleria varia]TWU00989.1 FtsX-like permease family protein [Stieleria varia]